MSYDFLLDDAAMNEMTATVQARAQGQKGTEQVDRIQGSLAQIA